MFEESHISSKRVLKFDGLLHTTQLFVCLSQLFWTSAFSQTEALQSAKTVKIHVAQKLEDQQLLSIEPIIHSLLKYTPLLIVTNAQDSTDVSINIQIWGRPLSAHYNISNLKTGASVSGTIRIEARGDSILQKSFAGRVAPPSSVNVVGLSIPYSQALYSRNGFFDVMTQMICEAFGEEVTRKLLTDRNQDVNPSVLDPILK